MGDDNIFIVGNPWGDPEPVEDPPLEPVTAPEDPQTVIVSNPWGADPVPTEDTPDGSNVVIVGNPWGEEPTPGAPGTFTVSNPWGADPVPSDGSPAGPNEVILSGPNIPLPPTLDPLLFPTIMENIQERQAADTWAKLMPGEPVPTNPDGSPLLPLQVYSELMARTNDPQIISMLRERIDAINAQISDSVNF